MTTHVVRTPDIGEGIAEVEIVAWHVKPGDTVREEQTLAEVMTDKATVEIPSPVSGRVVSVHGEVGQTMAVGSDLVKLDTGEREGGAAVTESGTASGESGPAPSESGNAVGEGSAASRAQPGPVSAQSAQALGRAAAGSGVESAVSTSASPAEDHSVPSAPPLHRSAKPLASPSVRRHARELGVELREVPGSGPEGRVLHADLQPWAARRVAGTAAEERTGATGGVAAKAHGPAADTLRTDEQVVPLAGLRRRIAQRMQEAKRRIPHFTYVEEVDVTELEVLRARLNGRWAEHHGRLTLLPFLVRALVLGVHEFPQMNARFDDQAGVVTRYAAVHVGIATQTAQGLMVPVLRHAGTRDLWANHSEIARLAEAARGGRATRDELTGSTITITSLGPLGGIVSTPIINPPEVAIVGINRIVERPVIRGGAVVARSMMNLSSSFDHRVIDGMEAAQFVQALRALLECPAMLFAVPP